MTIDSWEMKWRKGYGVTSEKSLLSYQRVVNKWV